MAIVDFHNHVMPGVDDGAQSSDECRYALQSFKRDGVAVVVATPHLEASLTTRPDDLGRRLEAFDSAFEIAQSTAKRLGDLEVLRGVELLLDVPVPNLRDDRLRLGGGPFFLMEFPFFAVPPHSVDAVRALVASGYQPIIAHPERYHGIDAELAIASEWRKNGAYLQINGGSLLGRYGAEARGAAFELLGRGWADYVCSDYHARGATLIEQYQSLFERIEAAEQAELLMQTNPGRMLEGLPPLPVPRVNAKRALWHRVAAMFRS